MNTKLPERDLLEQLVVIGVRFRNTPIVDNDFTTLRDEFDARLQEAKTFLAENKPPVLNLERVTIDGCMGPDEVVVTTIHRPA